MVWLVQGIKLSYIWFKRFSVGFIRVLGSQPSQTIFWNVSCHIIYIKYITKFCNNGYETIYIWCIIYFNVFSFPLILISYFLIIVEHINLYEIWIYMEKVCTYNIIFHSKQRFH